MRDAHPNDTIRFVELCRSIVRIVDSSPTSISNGTRRANDWTANGIRGGADNGRGGKGSHADPTAAAALAPATPDFNAAILNPIPLLEEAEQRMRELFRDPHAGLEERETTHTQDRLTAPAGSGRCPACDDVATGSDGDKLVLKTGLCKKCDRRWRRAQNDGTAFINGWHTIEDFASSLRNEKGLDLADDAA